MNQLLRTLLTKTKTAVLVLTILTAQVVAPFAATAHADPTSVPGDNGDIKTHNTTTAVTDTSDEPKVCGFYLDAFNFDTLQSVDWYITEGTHGDTVLDGSINLTNGAGYTANLTLTDGMYKLYWNFDGEHGAAKQKVFKVTCATPTIATQVSNNDLTLGDSVYDTATLTGTNKNGDVIGTVDFYVCDADAANADCVTDGMQAGSATIDEDGQAVSEDFTPTEAGDYCFWVVYNPDETASYLTASHTDPATECFTVSQPEVEPTYGTITVNKVLFPATDLGVFNLQIDGATAGTGANVGNGGTTGAVTKETGEHTVSETAGTATDMSNYSSSYLCMDGEETIASGTGTTIPAFTLETGENVVCTFTNQRHVIPQVLGDSTSTPTTPTVVKPAVLGAALTNTGLPVIAYVTAAMSLLGSAVFVISRRSPNLG